MKPLPVSILVFRFGNLVDQSEVEADRCCLFSKTVMRPEQYSDIDEHDRLAALQSDD